MTARLKKEVKFDILRSCFFVAVLRDLRVVKAS